MVKYDNERWAVFDDKGVIYEGPDYYEAEKEFHETPSFERDLYLVQVMETRR